MKHFFDWLRRGSTILADLLLLTAAAFALLLFIPKARGMQTYAVMSSSMEPAIVAGSMICVAPCGQADEIGLQDIIAYRSGQSLVVHRVVETDRDHQAFFTKGDHNSEADEAPVGFADVLGKVSFDIPYAGYVLMFIQGKGFRYLLFVSAAVLLVLILTAKTKEESC